MKAAVRLNRQGKNCECRPAHSFLFIILGGYVLLFHQSTMRIVYCVLYVFCAFCDVIVVKTFLLHEEQFALASKSMH